jgi:hypothetical protein
MGATKDNVLSSTRIMLVDVRTDLQAVLEEAISRQSDLKITGALNRELDVLLRTGQDSVQVVIISEAAWTLLRLGSG